MYTAFTSQIDNPEAAVAEIRTQLEPEKNMLKNTIGIAAFYHEYAENGVYKAVAAALPFDMVGTSSTVTGARGQTGEYSLAVTMLTSDDVTFATRSIETKNKSAGEINESLKKIFGEFIAQDKPKLVLSYLAPQPNFSGDDFMNTAAEIAKELLLFGSLAWNTDGVTEKSFVAFKENASPYLMDFVAIYGNFEPRFKVTTSLDMNALIKEAAVITSSEGPILKSINNIPAFDYLKKIGLVDEAMTDLAQFFAVPAIVIYENGKRVARAVLQTVTGDPKSLLVTGNTPVGAKISFALMDDEATLRSALEATQQFESEKVENSISYSCAVRSWSLGANFLSECEAFARYHEQLGKDGIPANYMLCYSGGEICPAPDINGNFENSLHSYTLISCIFE
jgi:hypothetical protein